MKTNSCILYGVAGCTTYDHHTGNDIHTACIICNIADDTITDHHSAVNNAITIAGNADINITQGTTQYTGACNDINSGTSR